MKSYARSHLADCTLLDNLAANTGKVCGAIADQIADIGEVLARKLYLPAGYPSMFRYCVHQLHMSEQAALKRIRVAKKARRFPAIFTAIADGRLHLSAVVLLAPRLTEDTAEELLSAATHKTSAEVEKLLAERFPQPDRPPMLGPASTTPLPPVRPMAPAMVATMDLRPVELSSRTVEPSVVAAAPVLGLPVEAPALRARVTPLAPERYELRTPIDQETDDLLRYAQALLSHAIAPGDLPAVVKRVVAEGVAQIERDKLGAKEPARAAHRHSVSDGRYVPCEVRRAVWQRDGGRCAFVSEDGVHCPETMWLQFDHIDPYATGGGATVGNIRLLCRAHNLYEAERTFGTEFMRHKRAAAESRAQT